MPKTPEPGPSALRRLRHSPVSRIAPLIFGLVGIGLFSSSPAPAPGLGFAVLVFAIALALTLALDAAASRRDQPTGPCDH